MGCPVCRCSCKDAVPVVVRVLKGCLVVDADGQALTREPGDHVTINKNSLDYLVLVGNRQAELVEAD